MRIHSTKRWLAAALMVGARVAKGADQSALVFDNQDFAEFGFNGIENIENGPPVLVLSTLNDGIKSGTGQPRRQFHWTTSNNNLQIEKVDLLWWNVTTREGTWIAEGKPNGAAPGLVPDSELSTATTPTNAANKAGGPTPTTHLSPSWTTLNARDIPLQGGQQPVIKLEVLSDPTKGSVTIPDVRELRGYSKLPLYFQAVWQNDSGKSFSRAFAVVSLPEEVSIADEPNSPLSSTSPIRPDINSTTDASSSGVRTGPIEAPTKASAPENSTNAPEGLTTGPIIGIAVACGILGLLLILGAIWFLIRRRNKQAGNTNYGSPGRPYGTGRSRTDDLIAEKEAGAGGADPSPHSPYSDDGVVLVPSAGHASSYHNRGSNGAIAVGTPVVAPILPQQIPQRPQPHDHHHQQAGPYATYSERGSIGALGGGGGSPSTHAASITHSTHTHDEATSRAGMGSPTAGRATPHSSLAPQYAHLVEEGMTEDEIRRLEDEERQLDAEIERAGRR